MSIIYCLAPEEYWQNYKEEAQYLPRDYEQEGFIHATKGDDLLVKVANRVYPSYDGNLVLLVIDENRIGSEVKYEQAKDGNLYPHIYGPLNMDAIIQVKHMVKRNGVWDLPAF
ncbi:DUF952 domain-containing protein [Aneurinibacillus sp. Ricciae_BoGa-3]|uniref:DUF952 domain-containing protein n=1 Tax=Aneurinibacillus sp. Ricciae_BoGa-3 TaxID=3022697 RepID=UPI0023413EB8|nr:DUF952 domain-containing protein [Aneurinibacillus sp. Ricciae_BoGa-3]WCK54933.1 DUF952 domain-containing protein [Aneurinibacillus sp. Ricciae_BoGa-3]